VRLTGQPIEEVSRTGVDIVAVLDISATEGMDMLMYAIIDKLCPNDRFSIVYHERRRMELMYMNEFGKDYARIISSKRIGSSPTAQNDIGAALEKGSKVRPYIQMMNGMLQVFLLLSREIHTSWLPFILVFRRFCVQKRKAADVWAAWCSCQMASTQRSCRHRSAPNILCIPLVSAPNITQSS
jgi:hypothetical protein